MLITTRVRIFNIDFTGGAHKRKSSIDSEDEDGDGRGYASSKLTFKYV